MKYVFQAVFSHSEGLDGDGTETHYTYYPATISDAAAGTMVTSVQASDALLSQSAPAGTSLNPFQLYYLHEYTTMQQFCSVQFFIFICLFFCSCFRSVVCYDVSAGGPYWSQPEVYCTSYTTLQCVMLPFPAS